MRAAIASPSQGIATANSPSFSLPLRFLIAAPAALVLAQAAVVFAGREIVRYYLLPADLAVTHLVVLGWITTVMIGALYQLTPVVFRTRLCSERLGRWQFSLHVCGVAVMVAGFARSWRAGPAVGGSLVVVGVLLFLYNMARTLTRATVWTMTGRYLLHAFAFLALVVTVGLTLAMDLAFHWFPIPRHLLAAHVYLGVVGWLGLTLMGVSYQLIPMFALIERPDERLAGAILKVTSAGLLLLALAQISNLPRLAVLLATLVLALGLLAYAFDVLRMLRRRRRRVLDLTQQHVIASTLSLVAAITVAVGIAAGNPSGAGAQTHWYLACGYLALGGWLSFAIMGHYYKILPFLVWQHRCSGRVGREPVPLLRDLYRARRARAAFYLYLVGYAGIAVCLLARWDAALPAVAIPSLMGSAGFAWTLVEVLGQHKLPAPGAPIRPIAGSVPHRERPEAGRPS